MEEKQSALSLITKSIKDSFVWVLGGDPYQGKTIIDLNPDPVTNEVTPGTNPINWTRIIIFLIGFGFLFLLVFPFVRSLPGRINNLRK